SPPASPGPAVFFSARRRLVAAQQRRRPGAHGRAVGRARQPTEHLVGGQVHGRPPDRGCGRGRSAGRAPALASVNYAGGFHGSPLARFGAAGQGDIVTRGAAAESRRESRKWPETRKTLGIPRVFLFFGK